MDNDEFVAIAKSIATDYKTLYVMGCFGAPMSNANKKRYSNNYKYNATNQRKNKIVNSSYDTFGFDCVCLIKGILWGWDGNLNNIYGGATYCSNNVPDVGSDDIMNYCTDVSRDFSNIEIGELVHLPGHVGIYIGNGLVVECTPIWKDGVQITSISNVSVNNNYNIRKWNEHGKLKFINYKNNPVIFVSEKSIQEIAYEVCMGKWGNNPERKQRLKAAGYSYEEVQRLVNKLVGQTSFVSLNYYTIPSYNGISIVDALKSIGVDFSFDNRKKIAYKNGFSSYSGTAEENLKLLSLLKKGKLLK